jgi:glycosyltransferase involved in cell wall biosynthesis
LLQTANLSAFQQLRRVLTEFEPDIVHVRIFLTQLSPLILPLLRSIPSLYHVAWYRSICPLGTKLLPNGSICKDPMGVACFQNRCLPLHDWFPLMLQMKLWRQWREVFDLVVANSESVKHQLMAEGIQPVEVVWNGIPVRSPRPPLTSPPTAVFAGRLVWEKGIDVLLKAFAHVVKQIPDAQLLLAGEGPEREALTALMTTLNLQNNVVLLGHLPRSQMEQRFANAWVQVVPSRWAEPFGIVAIESMMRGTAVVASNMGGLAEIVQNGQTGFLIPPDDVATLAQALVAILSDRALAEQMGKIGREVAVAHFSEDTFVDRFVEIYQILLRDKTKITANVS